MTTRISSDKRTADATVIGVNGNIVRIQSKGGAMMKNEVAYVCVGEERLKSEVLRIYDDIADLQVFEETYGVRYGDKVDLTGTMLSVSLGPGLLGVIYDGLQNRLTELAEVDGFFLKRGRDIRPLDGTRQWDFQPQREVGDLVAAGHVLGTVPELNIRHKIMAPFALPAPAAWKRSLAKKPSPPTWIRRSRASTSGPASSNCPTARQAA